MKDHAATLDATQPLEHFGAKGQEKLHVDLTDPTAQRVRYADNAAAHAALGDLTITGLDRHAAQSSAQKEVSASAKTESPSASAQSDAASIKPEHPNSTNLVDASAKSDSGAGQSETASKKHTDGGLSNSDSGSEKKDLSTLPINETHNSDGSTTKTYPDGRQETIYGPSDYRASKTVSPDGNETKVKFKDGMQVTDNKKTGETTATMPPGPNSPGYSSTMKDGKVVRQGEYRPE